MAELGFETGAPRSQSSTLMTVPDWLAVGEADGKVIIEANVLNTFCKRLNVC